MYETLDELLAALPGLAAEHRQELMGADGCFLVATRQGRKTYLTLADGLLSLSETGTSVPDCTVTADEADLLAMMAGKLNPAKALLFGKVKVQGDVKKLMALIGKLK